MIKPLTSLRFIFAFMVFLVHIVYSTSNIKVDSRIQWLFDNVFKEGSVGVGFFFTLSGFILAYNYSGKLSLNRVSIRNFWLKRFARLYPLHLLTLYFSIPMMYMLYPNSSISEFGSPLILNLLLLQSCVFPTGDNFFWGFNSVSWSVSAEMIFYVGFPFLVYFFKRMRNAFAFLVILGCITLPIIIFKATVLGMHPLWFYFFPLFRVWDFLIGIMLFEIYSYCRNTVAFKFATGLELLSVFIFILFFSFHNFVPLVYRYSCYYWFPIALIVLIFSFSKGRVSRMLSNKYFVYLGEVSYGFYMFHVLVIYYFVQLNNSYFIFQNFYLLVLFLLVSSIVVSCISYEFFEKPLNKFIVKKFV